MTPRQYYIKHPREVVEAMAAKAGTNLANFKLIALYGGACSKHLARSLSDASGNEMTLEEILFPEEHENKAS